ncbi:MULTISPECIES: pyridoxamine 5'-phosphate oxidase family protein [unclassified Paracoccus (in: a-proteobacteria)]|uniref:pyridoxamine 5'-phosphate oxidase family protein n=1 Tax=unclassified Paracoccus (in: a-proteobacteria) TaxID=2688777 RepID=UPI0012B330B2|nr:MULTISPECIES: pyridoxamine 5'-phosphate oxidase family protein [unclassified Paracoccus (in: a-proteobacteria)]UXU76478.1 pyridoxamine 5'-phosphate oxidase family protein [Paracoccus sp. SMMA_5]UXU82184.1 pyridoxamine 5'-phosphate oxidase family protein [Paracoccus sp. SMMA_5_TC]
MTEQLDLFWDRLGSINAGMLGTVDSLKFVPMSHYADRDEGALWFITAQGVDLVDEIQSGPRNAIHLIADSSGKLWARIEGRLELSQDQEKLDEIWNAVAASWFEGGQRDPDVRLLRLGLTSAEVWATTGGVGFLYQLAKARLTGEKPDMGDHFQLRF